MNIETPENDPEEIENVVEISPEDFAEMLNQLPILKEMLQERETKLLDLEKDANATVSEIETLKVEIEELRQEISEREDLL